MASIALVAIRSVPFQKAFLRMDGSNVTQSEDAGTGTVNCQFYEPGRLPIPNIGNNEVFELIPLGELSTGPGYAIRSLNYPQAFLRMDGSDVTQSEGAGSGTVNCQFYATGGPQSIDDYEVFEIIYLTPPSAPLP